jgi:hypothetical protein
MSTLQRRAEGGDRGYSVHPVLRVGVVHWTGEQSPLSALDVSGKPAVSQEHTETYVSPDVCSDPNRGWLVSEAAVEDSKQAVATQLITNESATDPISIHLKTPMEMSIVRIAS